MFHGIKTVKKNNKNYKLRNILYFIFLRLFGIYFIFMIGIIVYIYIYFIKGNLFLYDKEYQVAIKDVFYKAIDSYEGRVIKDNEKKWKSIRISLYDEYKIELFKSIKKHKKGTLGFHFYNPINRNSMILLNNHFVRLYYDGDKKYGEILLNTLQHEFMHALQHYSYVEKTYDEIINIMEKEKSCFGNRELFEIFIKEGMTKKIAVEEVLAHSLYSVCKPIQEYHRKNLGWWLKEKDKNNYINKYINNISTSKFKKDNL